MLAAFGLLLLLGLALAVRSLALAPHLDGQWHADAAGHPVLASGAVPALAEASGRPLTAVGDGTAVPQAVGTALLQRWPRWVAPAEERARHAVQQQALAQALASGEPTLHFADGRELPVAAAPRGLAGLGWAFWPLAASALCLALLGAAVLSSAWHVRALLFALMCGAQAMNLMALAVAAVPGLGLPLHALPLGLRAATDIVTAAAALHVVALHPLRQPRAARIALLAWGGAALWAAGMVVGPAAWAWGWTQATLLALCAGVVAVARRTVLVEPNPLAAILARMALAALALLGLLTALAVAAPLATHGRWPALAGACALAWTLGVAGLLAAVPFLARSRQLVREFALLAGAGSVAAALDLLFLALFPVGPHAAMAMALVAALVLYAAARHWLLQQIGSASVMTAGRTFEQLFRAARELQDGPERQSLVLGALLHDVFEPMAMERSPAAPGHGAGQPGARARVQGGGAVLAVPLPPVPALPGEGGASPLEPPGLLLLRYARRGKRLFTRDDARLADHIVEQLMRAVAYDRAVERGRSEERMRIAQDLHDDIGARLLTLMYRAPTPEMEDYIRHTLKDLKTLTRGLAAPSHRLGDAAAEWKSDLGARLAEAQVTLGWACSQDRDIELGTVQWSALTRVLRELTSNVLAHAQASRVEVRLHLQGRQLTLTVSDDGVGRDPQAWAHGLGLGGVRKRVRQLGGSVTWREQQPRGIVCQVRLPDFAPGA
jgi:signal transduction histidine kinase